MSSPLRIYHRGKLKTSEHFFLNTAFALIMSFKGTNETMCEGTSSKLKSTTTTTSTAVKIATKTTKKNKDRSKQRKPIKHQKSTKRNSIKKLVTATTIATKNKISIKP